MPETVRHFNRMSPLRAAVGQDIDKIDKIGGPAGAEIVRRQAFSFIPVGCTYDYFDFLHGFLLPFSADEKLRTLIHCAP